MNSFVFNLKATVASISVLFLCSSCMVIAPDGTSKSEKSTEAQKISRNADIAILKCGKNNVKSVTVEGFECK